jgi:hypothetical protein
MEAVNKFFEDENREFYFEGLNKLESTGGQNELMKRAVIFKSKTISWVL